MMVYRKLGKSAPFIVEGGFRTKRETTRTGESKKKTERKNLPV